MTMYGVDRSSAPAAVVTCGLRIAGRIGLHHSGTTLSELMVNEVVSADVGDEPKFRALGIDLPTGLAPELLACDHS